MTSSLTTAKLAATMALAMSSRPPTRRQDCTAEKRFRPDAKLADRNAEPMMPGPPLSIQGPTQVISPLMSVRHTRCLN